MYIVITVKGRNVSESRPMAINAGGQNSSLLSGQYFCKTFTVFVKAFIFELIQIPYYI